MFGIQGIPQIANNGGLPPIGLSGMASLGVRGYNPTLSDIGSYKVVENLTTLFRPDGSLRIRLEPRDITLRIRSRSEGEGRMVLNLPA